jgi:molybdopterin-guanine dinucleotide biosynthesis protein B
VILIEKVSRQPDLNDVARLFDAAYDIILTEGFKQSQAPKVQVHRHVTGPLLNNLENLIAVATDEPVETSARQFSINDIKGLVDLLEKDYIKPHRS